ncbi:hypothetical protein [Amycolatopsis rifamycinica]|uniref:Wadjet protein JetD C-terminal domain-containing protein n=1 Tax=Amycolatopsis rifamycinica TaxID=287986 RepID=A0A066TU09_9PSEU|nr:hypothetical protein [Amycolatopsis rifamycinica]KDN17042.1 hypothetical protein DV20_38720 [Amycolatopsis rifamycinica]
MLSQRAADLLAALKERAGRKKGLPLPALLDAYRQIDPEGDESHLRRPLLRRYLEELQEANLVRLPRARAGFDRLGRDESQWLPAKVWLVVEEEPKSREPGMVLHPGLSWVDNSGLRGGTALMGVISQINDWLFKHRAGPIVPLRERSLEIFNDEKKLDEYLYGPLFAQERKMLEVLRARVVAPPLHTEQVGNGDLLLVVENSTTFRCILDCLPGDHRLARVAWGAGASFRAAIRSVSPDWALREIRYFGDLDVAGLEIPRHASIIAERLGLPEVRPATSLYAALLDVGRPADAKRTPRPQTVESAVRWLDDAQRASASAVLMRGQRIAQEWVGMRALPASDRWHSSVR